MSLSWREIFPFAKVKTIESSTSDHLPIFSQASPNFRLGLFKRFRFENLWIRENGCKEVVERGWYSEVSGDICAKISNYGRFLDAWRSSIRGNFKSRIKNCKLKMAELRSMRDMEGIQLFQEARKELNRVLDQEYYYWRQRGKQFWYKEGDSNTRYFHRAATSRKRKNAIDRLKGEDGC